MNTPSFISHRMFVAALSHDENAVAQNHRAGGNAGAKSRKTPRDGQVKELTPQQLMLSLMSDGFEPWDI